MVELFTVGFFGRTPSVVIRPVASVTAGKLPTTAEVVRAKRPHPLEGLARCASITHSRTTAAHVGSLSRSPKLQKPKRKRHACEAGTYGIETAD